MASGRCNGEVLADASSDASRFAAGARYEAAEEASVDAVLCCESLDAGSESKELCDADSELPLPREPTRLMVLAAMSGD